MISNQEGWPILKIKNLVENSKGAIKTGPFGGNIKRSEMVNRGIKVYGQENLTYNDFSLLNWYITEEKFQSKLQQYELLSGDIIMNLMGTLGIARVFPKNAERGIIDNHLLRIRVDQKKILPEFLVLMLNEADMVQRQIKNFSQGATMQGLNTKIISQIRLKVPNINIQKKVVKMFLNIYNTQNLTQKIIESLRNLKKGLMQRLFTEGIGHDRFKDTRLGRIPENWEVKKIKDIGNVVGGGTPSTTNEDYWNGNICWVTPSEITNLKGKYINDSERKITKLGFEKSSAKIIPKNSLLMTSRATIGACAINKIDITTNQGFQNIIPSGVIEVEFLYYFMQTHRMQNLLQRYGSGSTFLEITNTSVKNMWVLIPNKEEQNKIVEILSNIDEKIENEIEYVEKMNIVKKGLMQQLLTGIKRVNV